ncbi:unnamed protein product, partial [marine sediment metagenome]
ALGPVAGIIGGIVSAIVMIKGMQKWVRNTAEMTEKQTVIMGELLKESRQTNRSVSSVQAGRLAAADPYGRGIGYWQTSMAYLTPSPFERRTLGGLASSRLRNTATREAADRARGATMAPFKRLGTDLSTSYHGLRAQATRGLFAGATNPSGTGFLAGAATGGLPGMLYAMYAGVSKGIDVSLYGGGPRKDMMNALRAQGRKGRVGALNRLQARGPDVTPGAAPGFRAGSAEEYAFRVQQQTNARNIENTIRWQDQVLQLLREMVQEGTITDPNVL